MPKAYSSMTERILALRPGASCVVSVSRLCRKTLQKHAPERRWTTQALDGGLLVTRIR